MDPIKKELEGLESRGNLAKAIQDVQSITNILSHARDSLHTNRKTTVTILAALQSPVKRSFDAVNDDLKAVHSGLNKYAKALEKLFRDRPSPSVESDPISANPTLVNRAIAMHLLRDGNFSVASTFIEEANKFSPSSGPRALVNFAPKSRAWDEDFATGTAKSKTLQNQFAQMYHILHELRIRQNLDPAIQWARAHSKELECRGSNLEFELCRLQFVRLFRSEVEQYPVPTDTGNPLNGNVPIPMQLGGPPRAWIYARNEFGAFQSRYAREIQQLVGAMAFWQNVEQSPYRQIFCHNASAWETAAGSFAREFCSLLGLSAESPLRTASTAGAIALPRIMKMQNIMKEKRTEWTTQHELPIEIPLPLAYHFHSIFVCPVSKEQATDQNPPMMMPCGHVIAKESLDKLSKGLTFKCPYCPNESKPRDARKVFLS